MSLPAGADSIIPIRTPSAPKVELELDVIGQNNYEAYNSVIIKMANLKAIEVVTEKRGDASGFMVGTDSFAVPVGA